MSFVGRINVYRCDDSRGQHEMVTKVDSLGDVPIFCRCDQCGGRAVSTWYRDIDQIRWPQYLWRTTKIFDTLTPFEKWQVRQGQLILRPANIRPKAVLVDRLR